MSSWACAKRGARTEAGGVTGVMAGDGPSDSSTSLSGLSSDTSSVASSARRHVTKWRPARHETLSAIDWTAIRVPTHKFKVKSKSW